MIYIVIEEFGRILAKPENEDIRIWIFLKKLLKKVKKMLDCGELMSKDLFI